MRLGRKDSITRRNVLGVLGALSAAAGIGLGAGALEAQTTVGAEKRSRDPTPGPVEVLELLRAEWGLPTGPQGAVVASRVASVLIEGLDSYDAVTDLLVAAVHLPVKVLGPSRFSEEDQRALKQAMLRAECRVRSAVTAVSEEEADAASAQAEVREAFDEYLSGIEALLVSSSPESSR